MFPLDNFMHYKNIHWLVFGLWRLSTNLSNIPRIVACLQTHRETDEVILKNLPLNYVAESTIKSDLYVGRPGY